MLTLSQIITKEKIALKYLPLLAGEVAALTELKHPNIIAVKVRRGHIDFLIWQVITFD